MTANEKRTEMLNWMMCRCDDSEISELYDVIELFSFKKCADDMASLGKYSTNEHLKRILSETPPDNNRIYDTNKHGAFFESIR